MTRLLFALSAFLMLSLVIPPAATPLLAQNGDPAEPAHRIYYSNGTPIASTNKPVAQREREAAEVQASIAECDGGDPGACVNLGRSYELGLGVEQNRPIAAELYQQACEGEIAVACFRLGQLFSIGLDDQAKADAAIALERACSLGSLSGCAKYSVALEHGEGIAAAPAAAATLLKRSCDQGGVDACRMIASTLLDPDRPLADRTEALQLLDRFCRAGEKEACLDALRTLRYGEEQDQFLVTEYLNQACFAGDSASCSDLGDRAYTGRTIAVECPSSEHLALMAA